MPSLIDLLLGNQQQSTANPNDPTGAYLGNLIDPATAAQFQAARAQLGNQGYFAGFNSAPAFGWGPDVLNGGYGKGLATALAAQSDLPKQTQEAAQTSDLVSQGKFRTLQGQQLLQQLGFQKLRMDNLLNEGQAGGGGIPGIGSPSGVPGMPSGGTSTSGGGYGGGKPGGGGPLGSLAGDVIDEMKRAGASDAFIQGALANGLAEGGFNEPWKKAGGGENSFGHWQFNANGELPGFQNTFGNTTDSRAQARYLMQRMGQISPSVLQTNDPKAATDAIAMGFEKYAGANPGDRYGYLNRVLQNWGNLGSTPDTSSGGPSGSGSGSGGGGFLAAGDSIGVGLTRYGGLSGKAVDSWNKPGGDQADSAGSRNPYQVLTSIQDHLAGNPNYYKGQNVLLSTGTMNDPRGQYTGVIPQQIQAIQNAGGNVILAGADTGQFADRNDALAQIAQKSNIPFAGPLPTNNVHPGPQGYKDYASAAMQMVPAQPAQAPQPAQAQGQPAQSQPPSTQFGVPPAFMAQVAADPRVRDKRMVAIMKGDADPLADLALGAYQEQLKNQIELQSAQAKAYETGAGTKRAELQYGPAIKGAETEAEQAAQLKYAGPIAQVKAPYSRGFAPTLHQVYNPSTGQYEYQEYRPSVPGLPGTAPTGSGTAPQAPQTPSGGGSPSQGAPGAPGPSGPSAAPTPAQSPVFGIAKPGPGSESELKARGTALGELPGKVSEQAELARSANSNMLTMLNDADNIYTGKGGDFWNEAAKYLRLIDPSYNQQVASGESFVKSGGALVRTAVKETSGRAAVQEYTAIQKALPSLETSPQGLRQVLGEFMGLNDYKAAKNQALADWMDPSKHPENKGSAAGFEPAFQKQVSPYAFLTLRMDAQHFQDFMTKLNQTPDGQRALQKLGGEWNFIKQNYLQPGY